MSIENAASADGAKQAANPGPKGRRAPRITRLNVAIVLVSVLLVVVAIFLTMRLIAVTNQSDDVYGEYKACSDADIQLMEGSDYLTTQVRLFITSGNRDFMDNYFKELLETKRRDEAVAVLQAQAGSEEAKADLVAALEASNELALVEEYAMRLMVEAEGIEENIPEPIENTQLTPEDEALSPTQKRELAASLVLGGSYDSMKATISQDVERSSDELLATLDQKLRGIERETSTLLMCLVAVGILLLVFVSLGGIATYQLVTRPMKIHATNLAEEGHLDQIGCFEIRRVADAYNKLLDQVRERAEHFKHEAEIDALTNLLNRGSYDRILAGREGDYALVLADIDHFKEVNDEYGHETGDDVICAVASVIESHFRSTDFVCRLGGDEFAIILPGATPKNCKAIEMKLTGIMKDLENIDDSLPTITLSFGVAFSDKNTEDIYNDADKALYDSKHAGRNRVTFFAG